MNIRRKWEKKKQSTAKVDLQVGNKMKYPLRSWVLGNGKWQKNQPTENQLNCYWWKIFVLWFFFSLFFSFFGFWPLQNDQKRKSHHSLSLNGFNTWFILKTDKFIASNTTADGYRIDFNHDQRRSYLYRYMADCPTHNLSFVHSFSFYVCSLIRFGSVPNRY